MLAAVVLNVPISQSVEQKTTSAAPPRRLDLSGFSSEPLPKKLDALFIHHSSGGQWLAAVGPSVGENSILRSDLNGGDLRARLEANGYRVHETSYGSRIGEKTDVFDWPPKFREQMDGILGSRPSG